MRGNNRRGERDEGGKTKEPRNGDLGEAGQVSGVTPIRPCGSVSQSPVLQHFPTMAGAGWAHGSEGGRLMAPRLTLTLWQDGYGNCPLAKLSPVG